MKHILHLKHSLALAALAIFMLMPGLGWGQIVISQIYGGGGNSGSVYKNDFIELFNRGTSNVSLSGYSVQYTSANGTTWTVTNLTNVTLAPGQYYLIQEAAGTGGTTNLPTPDAIGTLAMGGPAGKVALVSSQTLLTVPCPSASIVDFVGYGTTATCFEGSGPTPAPSNSNSVIRASGGCIDANNNAADFSAAIANPRNMASPTNVCSSPTITVSPTTLTNFSYVFGSGPSAEKTFTVSGGNLTGNIALVPPTDYEISTGTGGAFVATNPITLTQSGGAVSTTTIYARLKAGLAVGNYNNENIVASSAGATAQNVNCSGSVTMNYYSAASGNLDAITSWGANPDGTGSNPINFTADGQVFNIRNNATQTIGATWTVSGLGSKVVLGDGTNEVDFIIPSLFAFIGTVDLSANSTITIQNGTIPTFGTIHPASTVVYDGVAQNITQINYGNLTLSADGATFAGNTTGVSGNLILDNTVLGAPKISPFATISLGGDLMYIGTVTPPVDSSSITLSTKGAGIQTITGNGNTARWFKLQTTTSGNNVVLSQTGGSTNLYVGNLSSGGINLTPGSQLTLNGNTLTFFNGNGSIVGSGTITCNAGSNIIINKTGATAFGTLRLTPGSETLNNLTLNMSGGGNTVTLGSNLIVTGNLAINSGSFVVATGSQLTVNGTLTNSAGVNGLVVKSGGSLIQNTGGVNATVECAVNAWTDALHGWHLLSSPVAGQVISPAFTDPTPANYDFYQWGEATNTWLNQKDGTNNIVNFVSGTGYLVAYATSIAPKMFAGTLNATDIACSDLTLSGGTNSGWNLLGNPFPSALTWGTANWGLNNIAATAKIWGESGASYVDISAGGIIPAMNGFMVQTSAAGTGSLTIPLTARVHNALAWYKSSTGLLKLKAHDLDNSTAQESIIRVDENATEGYDAQYDSHFLAGFAPQFYSTVGGEQLSTNTLPGIDNSRVIPMGFVKNAAGNFSIELMENSLMGVSTIYLTDNKTGSITNMSTNPVYNFTSVAGDDANRFLLKFQGTASIPNPDITKDFTVHAENGVITILQTGNLSGKVTVTDMAGRNVATANLKAGSPTSINLQGHPGVYVVSIVSAEGVSNVKVIIN